MSDGWKITAIIFIVLFLVETAYVGWAVYITIDAEKKNTYCLYEYCKNYSYGEVLGNVCTCYEYDMLDQLVEVDYKVLE